MHSMLVLKYWPCTIPTQAELVDPAVRGTRAVMAAAAANKADVRRVVLTSSCAGELGQGWRQQLGRGAAVQ